MYTLVSIVNKDDTIIRHVSRSVVKKAKSVFMLKTGSPSFFLLYIDNYYSWILINSLCVIINIFGTFT